VLIGSTAFYQVKTGQENALTTYRYRRECETGDYILAINNTPVSSLPNLYDALIARLANK